eukprot:INCI15205.1.p1 GENE.INCI15205.1~~INCI15205.1.p1  ORF type:complete len:448 (+),score=144.58 INCI15205.1:179-1522(+)
MSQLRVQVCSGNVKETFSEAKETLSAARLEEFIRSRFEVADGADVPAVTYQDDEGDTISLNLKVPVEFDEALRVMQLDEAQSTLCFTLQEELEPRPLDAPPQTKVGSGLEAASDYSKQLAKHAELQAFYEASLSQHNAAMNDYLTVAAVSTPPTVQIEPAANPDASKVMNDISAIVQTFSAGMTQRVNTLEQEVAQHKRDAAVRQQQADESAARIQQLENTLQDQEQVVLACRQEAADLLSKNKEAEAAAAGHAEEKKRLVDTIAEQREQLSTKQLEVGDLKKENESLRAEIDAVYAKIAGLLPDVKRPSSLTKAMEKVAKGVEEFTETVEAVCVATKEEVTEALQSTNNYAKQPAATSTSAPKQGGGGAAAAAAAAAPVPSAFVQMMDREMDDAMTHLETELVSETDRDAFRKLHNMGFDVDQARVCELMAQHNGDVSVVLEELLQ